MFNAVLTLEDGTVMHGKAIGAEKDTVFELVFNTSMSGYQEILSDPSYRGQGVLFTVSHIGNVGVNVEDYESAIPQASAVVTRSISRVSSNWRAEESLDEWLKKFEVPGISDIDTRYLTRKLREQGTMKAALSTKGTEPERLIRMAREWPGLDNVDMVKEVTCSEPYNWLGDEGSHWVSSTETDLTSDDFPMVIAYDFGVKKNILRHLSALGLNVKVVPASFPADEALALNPDGIFLSNGPGDPAGLPYAVETVSKLIKSGKPVFGICLGHQLIGRALNGETRRLKFGHHGGNHPVQDLRSGKVMITAQNHNFTVEENSLDPDEVEITHKSLNDNTLEGIHLKHKPVFSVQYHPEASPGPHDANHLFIHFEKLIRENKKGN